MNEDFFDRLDKYITFSGLNDNKVTVQTGIPVGSLGKQRKGSRGLSVSSIAKILQTYSNINAEWLLTGEGEMLKSNSPRGNNEENLIATNRNLSETVRNLSETIKFLSAK